MMIVFKTKYELLARQYSNMFLETGWGPKRQTLVPGTQAAFDENQIWPVQHNEPLSCRYSVLWELSMRLAASKVACRCRLFLVLKCSTVSWFDLSLRVC